MKLKRGFTLIELLVVIAIIGILCAVALASFRHVRVSLAPKTAYACGFIVPCDSELTKAATVQKDLINAVPVPKLQTSLERENVSKRAQLFNTPDKISYIYLLSYGKVMAFYTVKGKVSSLESYMVPSQKLVRWDGTDCTSGSGSDCYVIDAPDIDGTYGANINGIFFFTTEGAYVEWKGDYMMSDQPLKLSTQPELVREVK